MRPREFRRLSEAFEKRAETGFINDVNATGFAVHQAVNLAFGGKAWEWQKGSQRGKQKAADLEERERAVLARLEARKRRKRVVNDG